MNIKNLLPEDVHKKRRQEAILLAKKWEKVGLLEGLKGHDKLNVAQLLESQAKQIITEANRTGVQSNSEEWAGIALPLVRRVYSEISAKEFVSVQPMNLPSGLVFWLEFKYGSAQPGFKTGEGKDSQEDSLYGVTDKRRGTSLHPYNADGTPVGGLYGPGRFGYSINDYSSSALTLGATPNATTYTTGSVTGMDYNFNSEFSQSLLVGGSSIVKVTVSTDALTNPDLEGARAFMLTGGGVHEVYQEFTKVDENNGLIHFVVSGSAFADGLKVLYHKQPTDITRGDFEAGKTQEDPIDIPEINMEFRSEPIVAKTRKLKAVWTPEFAQDINAYQNIDAEAELTAILGEYISQEIDFEILDMLIKNAQSTEYWSARVGFEWNGSEFAAVAGTSTYYTKPTWFQTLGIKMQKLSNRIHQLTMRGGANFIVVSPTVATILESIPGFAADTDGSKMKYAFGVQKIGMLNSRFQVYKNPYMIENVILMGFRGSNYLETGAVYAPYIPLILTPLIYDPEDFTPRKGVQTRYAKKITRPEFYGKIYVEGLNTL